MTIRFKRYHFLLFVVGLFATSCSSTKNITIDVPTKAKEDLPDRIKSILIVNRTVDNTWSDLKSDSLQNIFFAEGFDLDTVIRDKQAADTMLKALGDLLYESERYDIVIPENRFLAHEKNAFYTESIDWNEAKQLCNTFNTDAILSVDLFNTRVVSKYDRETYFDPTENYFSEVSEAHMAIIYEALFKIYDPAEEKILTNEFMRDTLVWEDYAGSARELFSRFTPVKQGLTEAAIALALDFSEKISTGWHREQRIIFTKGDDKLSEAEALVDQGNWDAANRLWEELAASSNSKSVKSKAQFNLAISAELRGDIDKAIAWGLESYNTMYHQATYDYLEYLNRRKKELQKQ